jgi:DNA polymerase-1
MKLLRQFGSLDEIYAHLEDITPSKLQVVLKEHQPRAFQNKGLVTIVKDAPISLDLEDCQVSAYDRSEVVKLFHELEFIKLLPRLPREFGEEASLPSTKMLPQVVYQVVDTETVLEQLISELGVAPNFAIEIETTHTLSPSFEGDSLTAELVGMVLSPLPERAFYIPLVRHVLDQPEPLPLSQVIARLKPILESRNIGKIAHDGKYGMAVLANYGVELENLNFDTMIAAHLLGEKNLALKAIAFSRLGREMIPPNNLGGKGEKQPSLAMLEVKELAGYACGNVDIIWSLAEGLREELCQQGLWQLFSEVEMPLIPVLVTMERNGITLDTDLLRRMSLELGQEMLNLEAEIYNSVGHQFNINSHQQLAKVLFEEIRLPCSRKTKSGYSTDASVLEGLKGLHPIIELILEYRQRSKLKSTYVDALPSLINHRTGRVHTTFNQAGTATGRLSSSEPNLQNIPVRGEVGRKIRQAIIAPPGSYLLSADYSQIDLRVLAHLCQDSGLIAAFANDEDIHATTASKLFSIPVSQVSPEMRRVAKTVNFGVIYGMSDYGLEQATELNREEASQFITLYFEKYPRVKEYIEATKEQTRRLGYVQTVMGRRRFIPEINSPNRQVRQSAERMAINAPVQGTSADIIKVAMINIHQEMRRRGLKSKMLLQIHDELIFELPEEETEEMKSLVAEIMPQAIKLCVPLKIDIKMGKNWGEMA